jgi:hypothetical protein
VVLSVRCLDCLTSDYFGQFRAVGEVAVDHCVQAFGIDDVCLGYGQVPTILPCSGRADLPVIFFDGTRSMVHGPHTSSPDQRATQCVSTRSVGYRPMGSGSRSSCWHLPEPEPCKNHGNRAFDFWRNELTFVRTSSRTFGTRLRRICNVAPTACWQAVRRIGATAPYYSAGRVAVGSMR